MYSLKKMILCNFNISRSHLPYEADILETTIFSFLYETVSKIHDIYWS